MSDKVNCVQTLEGHTSRIWSCSWAPNGNAIATCSGDRTVRIWAPVSPGDYSAWVCKASLKDAHQRTIRWCSWNPSGKMLACASFDGTTSIWQYFSGEWECSATLDGHENEVKCCAWSPSGELLATCSRDKSVWIWEMERDGEFECVGVLHGHSQDVKRVAWHPSKELLCSASYDDTLKIWENAEDDWFCSGTLDGHSSTVWDCTFDGEGKRLFSASDDKTLRVWEPSRRGDGKEEWRCVCTISGHHTRSIYSVSCSPVSGLIATGAGDDSIRIFAQDPAQPGATGPSFTQKTCVEHAHATDVNCVAWHPHDGGLLASVGDDGLLKLWRVSDAL